MPPALPKIIALCGTPNSGKSTATRILNRLYGYEIIDDGLPLRQMAMNHLGLTEDQVFTQAGKLEKITLNDREWEAREILGEIGNAFEDKFGGDIIPLMSSRKLDPTKRYVAGSVRRDQGYFWKKQGALVIEIYRDGCAPSPFEFDRYALGAIDRTVGNPAPMDIDESCPVTMAYATAAFASNLRRAVEGRV